MLAITIPAIEFYDESKEEFVETQKTILKMEHSLVSLRDWESKWKVSFFHTDKTKEQLLDYLKMMTLTEEVSDIVYRTIPESEMKKITEYIKDSHTAMTINDSLNRRQTRSNELVTAETIYWWMISLGIPMECETWHLERLLALIKFISIKNDPKKTKMSQKDVIRQNAEINARNRAKYGIKG